MVRNIARGSTGINSSVIAIQDFSLQFIVLYQKYGYNNLRERYHTLQC